MFYERLKMVCDQKGVKVTDLVKELGLSSGNLSSWKGGTVPKSGTVKKLSDRLGVSSDYLIGKTDDPLNLDLSTLTDRQKKLLNLSEQCTDEELMAAFNVLEAFINSRKK